MSNQSTTTTGRDKPLYPSRIVPPARPHSRPRFVVDFLRNPLRTIPAATYTDDIVRRDQSGQAIVWITASPLIKQVLLEDRDKFRKTTQIRMLSPLLGNGLLTSDGDDWKWQRQAAAPEFRHSDLLALVPTIVAAADALVTVWRQAPSGTVHPVDRDLTRATFDVISATLLPSGDRTVAPAIEGSTGSFQRNTAWRLLYSLLRLPPWIPQPGRAQSFASIRSLRASTHAMIAERRAMTNPPDDLMARLMRAKHPETGRGMTDEQLVDNLLTFYLAGHETTAKTLTWTLYLLAREPDWSDRIAHEVEQVTGGAAIAAEHIDRLVLTQQVLKEAMRLYPPAPIISRQPSEPVIVGGEKLPAGAQVVMPIYAIHRHVKYWTDPDRFDPDRFTPERERAMTRYQWMPFGAGPRICIGMAFAMIEATALLATLVRAARFSASPDLSPEPLARVTLVPKGGMPLAVSMR